MKIVKIAKRLDGETSMIGKALAKVETDGIRADRTGGYMHDAEVDERVAVKIPYIRGCCCGCDCQGTGTM